ncbi:hypothetical protein KIL84_010294 [Mauremys mutica]|uniref:Uncharacterized protein n=1 Tax=Mauremys mutica TaxID=74926 RepID=A0A9D4AUB1_9SAUR|nr:hypothetical protein KIL84_010294 [Mauremys mutica]
MWCPCWLDARPCLGPIPLVFHCSPQEPFPSHGPSLVPGAIRCALPSSHSLQEPDSLTAHPRKMLSSLLPAHCKPVPHRNCSLQFGRGAAGTSSESKGCQGGECCGAECGGLPSPLSHAACRSDPPPSTGPWAITPPPRCRHQAKLATGWLPAAFYAAPFVPGMGASRVAFLAPSRARTV